MDDEEPFIKMILERPSDSGPKLVFADWLEDQGRADLALAFRAFGNQEGDFVWSRPNETKDDIIDSIKRYCMLINVANDYIERF